MNVLLKLINAVISALLTKFRKRVCAMNRACDISASVYCDGERLRVWCTSFTVRGKLSGNPGKDLEALRARIENKIADAIGKINFGDLS
jgi:hypothetical protein